MVHNGMNDFSNCFRQQKKEFGMPPKPGKKTQTARRSGDWLVGSQAAGGQEDAARAREAGEGSSQQAGEVRREGERESTESGGGEEVGQAEAERRRAEEERWERR